MDSGIRARECGLADILAPGMVLRMPPYQRSYSWEEGEVRELVNDLVHASDELRFHFIGAIVLVQMEDDTFLVVDGQQRLTTITMILAVLRDLETEESHRALIHALIGDPDRAMLGEKAAWRLTLNHIDNLYFREAVQDNNATKRKEIESSDGANHKRMSKNLDLLKGLLEDMSLAKRRGLFETIRDRIVVVRVTVPDWNGGYDVFRVLNTRGKAPSSHDIVKTEILQRAGFNVDEASKYAREWLDHESTLGGAGLDDLLSIIRQIYGKASKNKSVKDFAKVVLSKVEPVVFLDKELPRYVEAFRIIQKGDPKFDAHNIEIKTAIDHLRLIDHALWKVPAVAYLYRNTTDGADALHFFQKLERFAYAMMLYFTNSEARQKRYRRLTQEILSDKPLFERSGQLEFTRDDEKKIRDRLTGRFSNFAQRRAVALRLNAALESGEPVEPEEDATVEHVLPKAVPEDSFWNTVWPKGTIQRELCETIGNFVIVPQHINRAADRHDFRTKKTYFFEKGGRVFALTEDLRNRNTWTAEDVRARTEQLVDILMNVWFGDNS